ncbi:PREDICTED: 50S ribosomal protein 6, chloroplastic [Fragaria vesca subsp. vesca]|uniref:50S ribosomal protein 6, chloroplastic n=1 Tax=Fragaria vesca subsp. vesca TaxID=101020 RepID=UPI0002C37406|nr:PREDICTED: 50S ribosomal protein 6, chloroplastic [Fragaria vesca subsp. vesca]
MSVSAVMLGPQLLSMPVPLRNPSAKASFGLTQMAPPLCGGSTGLVIECSSRPQKKATAHHRKTRPRKTAAWDVKRKPTVYAPLPPLPADWVFLNSSDDASAADPSPPQEQATVQ